MQMLAGSNDHLESSDSISQSNLHVIKQCINFIAGMSPSNSNMNVISNMHADIFALRD